MRSRSLLLAVIGFWPCLAFSQVEVTSIPVTTTLERGQLGEFRSTIRNSTGQPLSGAIVASLTITGPGKINSVTSNNPAMKCDRATSPTVEAFVCNANPITLGIAESLTLVTTVTADSLAEYGRVIDLRTLVVCGGTFETHSQIVIENTGGNPLLKITITKFDQTPSDPGRLIYNFRVTNHGNGPTTHPIDVEITPQNPHNGEPATGNGWDRPGAAIRHRMDVVLQPGESRLTPDLKFPAVRGTYRITALVAGGGSVPDEKTDVHQIIPRETGPVSEEMPQSINGRQR